MVTNQRAVRLNSFAVMATIDSLDFAELEYRECMDLMQELLELPQGLGVPLGRQGDVTDELGYNEDWSAVVAERMIEAGYSKETAWKCRNSAASKANKGPRKARKLHTFRDAMTGIHTLLNTVTPAKEVLEEVLC